MKFLYIGVGIMGAALLAAAALRPSHRTTYAIPDEPVAASGYNSYRGVNLIIGEPVDYSHLRALGANWVALVVQCHHSGTQTDCTKVPDDERIRGEMYAARAAGLRVMLKPHIETTQHRWRGDIAFRTQAQILEWFAGYAPIVLRLAALQPDAVAVGTELKGLSRNEYQWRALIAQVRQSYPGLVTYAANFDEVAAVPWWDAVDFIGVDAYFPLRAPEYATVEELVRAWAPHRDLLAQVAQHWGKQIVFTEVGYESRVASHRTPWDRNPAIPDMNAQAFAYQAVFETFSSVTWWAGALFWDWQHDKDGLGFMPANKPALGVLLSNWRAQGDAEVTSAR